MPSATVRVDGQPAETAPPVEAQKRPPEPPDASAEQELWAGRTQWQHYAGSIALWVVAAAAYAVAVGWVASRVDAISARGGAYLAVIPILLSGMYLGARLVLRILSQRYRVTHQRLFIERGILSRTIDQTELIRVDDVRVQKTVADRIFGLGSVEVVSTDVSDQRVCLVGVRGGDDVAETIRQRMRVLRKSSLYIEQI